jgi:hypothetical protein
MRTSLARRWLVWLPIIWLLPEVSVAQPNAWVLQRPAGTLSWSLFVVNLATGQRVAAVDLAGIDFASGTLSPDGQFYYLSTSYGLAKFSTVSRSLVSLSGPPFAGTVAVSGRWIHVFSRTPGREVVLDATTGAVVSDRCCDAPLYMVFSSDGAVRFEFRSDFVLSRTVITAYPEGTDAAPLWEKTISGLATPGPAGIDDVVYRVNSDVVVLNAATGEERSRFNVRTLFGLAMHGRVLYVSAEGPPAPPFDSGPSQVLRVDLVTMSVTLLKDFGGAVSHSSDRPVGLSVSSDGKVLYLLHFFSILGLTFSNTSYLVIDTATGG